MMPLMRRWMNPDMPGIAAVAAVLGLIAVGMGAFGAHAFKLEMPQSGWFETANRYHFYHVLALLTLAFASRGAGWWWSAAAWAWIVGILIFCGSLYAMALGAPRWLGAVAPIGGTALMLGWLFLLVAVSRI